MSGLCRIERATMRRCAMPPERAKTDALAQLAKWNCSSSWSAADLASLAGIPNRRPW